MATARFFLTFQTTVKPVLGGGGTTKVEVLAAKKLTQSRPSEPEGLVVEFVVEIADEFLIPKIEARLDTLGSSGKALLQTAQELSEPF